MFSCYLLQYRVLKHNGLGWFVTKPWRPVGGPQGRIRRYYNTYNQWQREGFYMQISFISFLTNFKHIYPYVVAEMSRSSFGLK